jgi:UDP-N-acetylglucosamine--N-acetylmuramyl-(pentapeptide) pyrophosphoryl-undecaprenol N-acetylglucosamine transferase
MKAKRFQVTGNPVRQDIIAMSRQPQRKHAALHQLAPHWYAEKPVLMVTGGSQGARSINQAMAAIVPELLDTLNILVIHQTGKKLYDETLEALPEAYREHPNYLLRPYFDDMAPLLASADLAVCRSGSLSLSELMVCGIPTILIPYPYAAADHQRKNAEAQVAAGTSRMIADKELTGPVLLNAIRSLINEPEALQRMKAAALKMSHPDATEAIVRVLSGVATERART